MKKLSKHLRLFALAAAFALAMQPLASITTVTTANATACSYSSYSCAPAAMAGGGSSAGGWIIGGLFISVASIIACAMIVGSEEGRELTLDEAVHAGLVPLHCLLTRHLDDL